MISSNTANSPERQKELLGLVAKESGYDTVFKVKNRDNVKAHTTKTISKRRSKNKSAKQSRKRNR
jgi:hypothetical protein